MSSGFIGDTGGAATITYTVPSTVSYAIINISSGYGVSSSSNRASYTPTVEVFGPGQTFTRTGSGSTVGSGLYNIYAASVIEVSNTSTNKIKPIRSNFDVFLNSGTWVCPAGVTAIYVTGTAGGGGGGNYGTASGANGGNTSFGELLTLGGGAGGNSSTSIYATGGAGGAGKPNISDSYNGINGEGTTYYGKTGTGGRSGVSDSGLSAGLRGVGGNSLNSTYGGGGGGGGGAYYQKFTVVPGTSYAVTVGAGGGNGNQGFLYVEW